MSRDKIARMNNYQADNIMMAGYRGDETTSVQRSRTILWCVPRSASCALTRCLSAITDVEVWYEPFFFGYASKVDYRRRRGVELPKTYRGNEKLFREAADNMEDLSHFKIDPEYLPYGSVQDKLEKSTSPHVFVKDMGFGVNRDEFQFFPAGYRHTFLIRHPLRVLSSNRKAMFDQFSLMNALEGEAANENTYDLEKHDPYMTPGLLFRDIHDIWQHVRHTSGNDPIVIDADELLANPAEILPKYCRAVGLPYDDSLLEFRRDVITKWRSPMCVDDLRMTVMSFSGAAMNSTQFTPPDVVPSRDQMTPDVIRCADRVMDYYEEMYGSRLRVE